MANTDGSFTGGGGEFGGGGASGGWSSGTNPVTGAGSAPKNNTTVISGSGAVDKTIVRDYIDQDYPQLFALNFDRGQETYADDYLRIGDSAFKVPPTAISIRQRTRSNVEDVLRTPGGMVLASGFTQAEVVIQMVFTNVQEIFGLSPLQYDGSSQADDARRTGPNKEYYISPEVHPGSLAALIAQFKRTPIVPVVNELLNASYKIDSLALASILVETKMDDSGKPIPNTLDVTIVANAFETQAMCPHVMSFDQAFIWPLQRWFWRQEWTENLPGQWRTLLKGTQTNTQPTPPQGADVNYANNLPNSNNIFSVNSPHLDGAMSGGFQFSIVSKDWISNMQKLRTEYERLQNFTYTAAFQNLDQPARTNVTTNLSNFAAIISNYTGADEARLEPRELGKDLTLMHVSASLSNNFSPLQIPGFENPTYQHLSQGDVRIVATFWAESSTGLLAFQNLIGDAREIVRDSRFELVSGFIGFENEIASLFNCHAVVFTDIQSRSIQGVPDNYVITVEMIGFNRHQRRLEALKSASDSSNFLTQYISPVAAQGQVFNQLQNTANIFWLRYFGSQYPESQEHPSSTSDGVAAQSAFDEQARPLNAWFNMAYIQQAKEQMANMELYPDLALPTYDRVMQAIYGGEIFTNPSEITAQAALQQARNSLWSQGGRFVDPDFYIDYPNTKIAVNFAGINTNTSSYISVIASQIGTITKQLWDVVGVDGSMRSKLGDILGDTMPNAGLYNIDPRAENHGDVAGAGGSDGALQDAKGMGVDNNGNIANRRLQHGSVTMPTAKSNISSIITATSKAVAFTSDVDGKAINHPDEADLSSYSKDGSKEQAHITYLTNATAASTTSIHDHMESVFGKADGALPDDKLGLLNQAIMTQHPVDVGDTAASEFERLAGTLSDMLEFDVTGRLVQAYPTYVLQIIDEGPRLGWVRIFPNFYAIHALQSIDIIQDRRDPAHTAILEVMNMYGNLSSYSQIQHDLNSLASITSSTNAPDKIVGNIINAAGTIANSVTNNITGTSAQASSNFNADTNVSVSRALEGIIQPIRNLFPNVAIFGQPVSDEVADLRRQQRSQIMLRPGARIHIRMGYGSNGAAFPVLFNGRITEIAYGERMQIIAQGDGVELMKQIPTSESETNTLNPPSQVRGPFIATGFDPRHLICMMLSAHNQNLFDYGIPAVVSNAWKNFFWKTSDGSLFADNPMGIMHFGNPILFDYWNALNNSPNETSSDAPHNFDKGPNASSSYEAAKTLVNINQAPVGFRDYVIAANNALSNPLPIVPISGSSLVAGASAVDTLLNKIPGTSPSYVLTNATKLLVGVGATLFTHEIPSGYGETGENVYPVYSPFDRFIKAFGHNLTASAATKMYGNSLGDVATDFSTAMSESQLPPDPPSLTPVDDVGALHYPGCSFNMYTHNKTVWEVVEFMSQAFPPYIAAVRPFEYRSTLFFGSPYFTYRYDYNRVTASDLGALSTTNNANNSDDKYFGYPYSYKTKPFMQVHFLDSRLNIISNNVRASDEDTFTDIIALWYKGQGKEDKRPEPVPVKQTVDKQIMPALRKTAVVNTDYVGCDVPPTGAAILGSCGTAELSYLIKSFSVPFFKDISINGGINYYVMEENMRQTARAFLRDYQKLMYQGRILTLGDPTLKPYDIISVNDEYVRMTGMAGVRRVIWHFSQDTGFVSSIEPDLLCEVKGENYLTSLWTWVGGYVAANLAATYASDLGLAYARKRFIRAVLGFGLIAVKEQAKFVGSLAKLKIPFKGFSIGGQRIEKYTLGFLVGNVRELFLDQLFIILGKTGYTGPGAFGTFADFNTYMTGIFKDARSLTGANAIDKISRSELAKKFDEIITEAIEKNTNSFFSSVLNSAKSNIAGTLADVSSSTVGNIELEVAIKRLSTTTMLADVCDSFIGRSRGLFSLARAAEQSKIAGQFVKAFGKVAMEAVLKRGGTAAASGALGELLLPAIGVAVGGPIGLVVAVGFELLTSFLFTQVSRYWDDSYSLNMTFLKYHGVELSAGLNGHLPEMVIHASDPADEKFILTPAIMKELTTSGAITMKSSIQSILKYDISTNPDTLGSANVVDSNQVAQIDAQLPEGGVITIAPPGNAQAQRKELLASDNLKYQGDATAIAQMKNDIATVYSAGGVGTTDTLINLLYQIVIVQNHKVLITALNANHSKYTKRGTLSNHGQGRAVDFSYIDGTSADMPQAIPMFQVAQSTIVTYGSSILAEVGTCPTLLRRLKPASGFTNIFEDGTDAAAHLHLGVNA